jgi:hypothetical protein
MLRHPRPSRIWWATVLMAGLWAGPLGPGGLIHLAEDDDPVCAAPAPADGTQRTVAAADWPVVPAAEHCATCHWLCSLRWQSPPALDVGLGVSAAGLVSAASWLSAPNARVLRLPARSPPALA